MERQKRLDMISGALQGGVRFAQPLGNLEFVQRDLLPSGTVLCFGEMILVFPV